MESVELLKLVLFLRLVKFVEFVEFVVFWFVIVGFTGIGYVELEITIELFIN